MSQQQLSGDSKKGNAASSSMILILLQWYGFPLLFPSVDAYIYDTMTNRKREAKFIIIINMSSLMEKLTNILYKTMLLRQ